MTDLRAFLRRHIEAFLDFEFGEATAQNTTPPGARRPVWTSEHTQRLVDHLASNWQMVDDHRLVESHRRAMAKALPTADPGDVETPELEDAISRLEADERNRRAAQRGPDEIAAVKAQATVPTRPLPAPSHGGLHRVVCDYCPVTFGCGCPTLGGPHMCMGCDTVAEESKMAPPTLCKPEGLDQ